MQHPPVGCDSYDATSAQVDVPDFAEGLQSASSLDSSPLKGKTIGWIRETMGEGVDAGVHDAVENALRHMESLGASVSEASSNPVQGFQTTKNEMQALKLHYCLQQATPCKRLRSQCLHRKCIFPLFESNTYSPHRKP